MRKSGSLSITAARGALLALIGPELLAPGGGAPIPTSALQGPSKILCLLFTAQWCTTSSEDMSSLVEYYHQLKDSHPRADCFEFLFVSCDDSRESFQSFREQMPWPAVPFNDDVSVQLSQSLEVLQLPSMLVLHASSGKVLSRDVLEAIEEDGAAVRGDWLTKALGSCLVMA